MAQGCAESPAGSGADPTAAVAGTIFLYLRSGRGKESRFRYLRIMTPIIADRKSGKPLFGAVWMRCSTRTRSGAWRGQMRLPRIGPDLTLIPP